MTDSDFYSILSRCMPDYTVVENIGSGNYGSVYKCERDGIYYAVKIISVPANEKELQVLLARSDEESVKTYLKDKVEGYRKEIMLMAELKGNRSIVNIEDYKVFESDIGLWYIVIRMELLTSLPMYASKNELDENEVMRLGIDICDAISICEKHNIIHRDIKPENIMRHNEGAFKLGDFGVAKQLSKTTAGTIAGTEGFMAPEVYKGQEYNQTADIYSLGIVLYYFLNNQKMPYVDPNDKSLIAEQKAIERRMSDESPLPLPPKASKNLGQIVVKACMFDKNCRYRSAADMRQDLVKVLNGEDIIVDLAPAMERGTVALLNNNNRPATSNKSTIPQNHNDNNIGNDVKTSISPASNSVNSACAENAQSRSRGTATFDIDDKPKKKKKGLIITLVIICLIALGIGGFLVYQKFFSGPKPGIYLDKNGNKYEVLSKEAMEEAYNLGVQYAEQGEYQEAIKEFNKVSEHSGKYEEAQDAIVKAKEDYQASLIEKANTYTENKDYEKAFAMIDTGVAALGDNTKFKEAKNAILAALKLDYVARAEEQEKIENYDKAFEYVNFALTYLPEDYELKGIQSRVNAANIAKKAIEKAAEYKFKSEYSKLFSTLSKALDDVTDSTSATASLKLAYDNYMEEYLDLIETQTSDLETVSDYETAIKLLESAVEIFPNDYELKKQLQETKEMGTAVKAISEADAYAGKDDFVNLFKSLNKALETLPQGSQSAKKVQSAYDQYRNDYIFNLNEQIGEPTTTSEYRAAISLIEAALQVFPEDRELQSRLDAYKASIAVKLFSLETLRTDHCMGREWISGTKGANFNTNAKDNYGNEYFNTAVVSLEDDNWYSHTHSRFYYDVANYNNLSGLVALHFDSRSHKVENFKVTIEAVIDDNNVVLETYNLNSLVKPQTFSIDISKYDIICISVSANDDGVSAILHDFTLS